MYDSWLRKYNDRSAPQAAMHSHQPFLLYFGIPFVSFRGAGAVAASLPALTGAE